MTRCHSLILGTRISASYHSKMTTKVNGRYGSNISRAAGDLAVRVSRRYSNRQNLPIHRRSSLGSASSTDQGGRKRRGSGSSIIALSLTRDCKPRKAKGATQT
jgi:hypothetical protein